jgi:hypothetical protein
MVRLSDPLAFAYAAGLNKLLLLSLRESDMQLCSFRFHVTQVLKQAEQEYTKKNVV